MTGPACLFGNYNECVRETTNIYLPALDHHQGVPKYTKSNVLTWMSPKSFQGTICNTFWWQNYLLQCLLAANQQKLRRGDVRSSPPYQKLIHSMWKNHRSYDKFKWSNKNCRMIILLSEFPPALACSVRHKHQLLLFWSVTNAERGRRTVWSIHR